MMAANHIVLDIEIPQFVENRVLDPDYSSRFPGASVYSCLASVARARGWEISTADVFLRQAPAFQRAVTVSNEFTPFLPQLIARGVVPGVLVSGESPNVAPQFYRDLTKRSGVFAYACLFRGALRRLAAGVRRRPWFWPCPDRVIEDGPQWSQRRLVGMVAGFKGVWTGPRTLLATAPSVLVRRLEQIVEPSLRMQDLYRVRWELVRAFAREREFVLRGKGWEHTTRRGRRWYRWPLDYANEPSPCDDKLEVLALCKFGLAIENAAYPGYVTEKIFDVLRAGAVPVYRGAPDIEDFVPAGCFIDYGRFESPKALWSHLRAMSEGDWARYRVRGQEFLRSVQYARHREDAVARGWFDWAESAGR
ncbi:MAG: glycosyltransferase family 10 [Myxococcales bacterium]